MQVQKVLGKQVEKAVKKPQPLGKEGGTLVVALQTGALGRLNFLYRFRRVPKFLVDSFYAVIDDVLLLKLRQI